MRKINDEELLQLSADGMAGKDIAEIMGCSPAAISKRLAKLRLQAPPESFSRLTAKEQKFAVALSEGKTQTQAAMESFETGSIDSAKTIGCRLAKDPDISLAVSDLLAQVGLTKRRRAERLRDMIECPDLSIVGRGLELSYKLDRSMVDVVEYRATIDDIRSLQALIPIMQGAVSIELDESPEVQQALAMLEAIGGKKRVIGTPIDITPTE